MVSVVRLLLMLVHLRNQDFNVVSGRNDRYWHGITSGAWEPDTYPIFERFVDRDHSYIDMGAYIGPTLLYGCQIAKRVYGIEPDPIAFDELQQNVSLNRPITDNVQLFEVCIAPRSGEVAFGNCGAGGDSVSSLLFGDRKTHWIVKALTFEDFMRQAGVTDCNFIKMDIEGGEYRLLPTMLPYLRAHRPTLHLSLHPCHLGKRGIGLIGKLFVRLVSTLRLAACVRLYRHLYDSHGRPLTFASLLWQSRAKVTLDVVLTDRDWDRPAPVLAAAQAGRP
jgi:FkbM family methyltransferase